jgi:ferredoxin
VQLLRKEKSEDGYMGNSGTRKIPPKKVMLAYFSGTGGTKLVCQHFEGEFQKRKIATEILDIASWRKPNLKDVDILIILSPVYGFRLASITEKWVKNLPITSNIQAVIISVSGGGDVSPNTACREYSKKQLIKKGYKYIYENMISMPSNFAFQAEEDMNLALISILPEKVEKMVQHIGSGKVRITKPKIQDKVFVWLGQGEHIGARFFGASIKANSNCNHCGLCIQKCPQKNIKMVDGNPKYAFSCIWCMKCIYQCPHKALSPRIGKFTVLKNGFSIKEMQERANKRTAIKRTYKRNPLWQGAIDYLNEK